MADRVVLSGPDQVLKPIIPLVIELNEMLTELRAMRESKPESRNWKNRPQILLSFSRDPKTIPISGTTTQSELSFRVMDKFITGENRITPQDALLYAQRIKSKFAEPVFIWKKGKRKVSYCDWNKGLQLTPLCLNYAEGKRVVEQLLDVAQVPTNWDLLNEIVSPPGRYPNTTPQELVFDELREEDLERPEIDVFFRHAQLILGARKIVTLVDLTGKLPPPLVN